MVMLENFQILEQKINNVEMLPIKWFKVVKKDRGFSIFLWFAQPLMQILARSEATSHLEAN